MRFEITAPVSTFSGEVAGVHFARGLAQLDTEEKGGAQALAYFSRKAYGITPLDAADDAEQDPPQGGGGEGSGSGPEDTKPPARSANKDTWVDYALTRARDDDEADAIREMTKDQLVDTYGEQVDG